MVFNTFAVGAAVTPTVIKTSLLHYLNRKPLHEKPTAHVSYDIGLNLIRQFLVYASHHTVEELQSFTAQWVPNPHWVRVEEVEIPEYHLKASAAKIQRQLGELGIAAVGGQNWWQWRLEAVPLRAEWIEMRKDANLRKQTQQKCTKCMLYIHGGAYFFGSVDEHRYQMQRHARKLQARVFAPRYRLAPQFPFPCGLQDCLATYEYLLTVQDPETIILAGDSAGGGMIVSLLVLLRDQNLPLPAGAILLSPWVDLTHSFPSVAGQNNLDYVPSHGFMHRPSVSWPPPNSDDLQHLYAARNKAAFIVDATKEVGKANEAVSLPPSSDQKEHHVTAENQANQVLSVVIKGREVEIKDQIQMYTTNTLLSHPLVSPALQPSLGGLPPLFILVGGAEMLRDEQIYLAHKAAAPSKFATPFTALRFLTQDAIRDAKKWPPTDVQLQVWDDMCHVAPTLSFTRPAKYMYRSIAQFGAWALAKAQKQAIHIVDDDAVSIISTTSSELPSEEINAINEASRLAMKSHAVRQSYDRIGRAGDNLPPFISHMIRQRVNRHGEIFSLAPAATLPSMMMDPGQVGTIKPDTVEKWMRANMAWGKKYAKEKQAVYELRRKEAIAMSEICQFPGEHPPPTALVCRRRADDSVTKPEHRKKSRALAMWSGWGSKHDKVTLERQEEKGEPDEKIIIAERSSKDLPTTPVLRDNPSE